MDRDLRLLLVVVTLTFTGDLTVQPMIALYAQDVLGLDELWVGAAVAAYAFLPLLCAVPIGASVDRLGARRLLRAGAAGMVVALAVLMAWQGLPGLLLAQLLGGLAHLLFIVASQTYVARAGRKEDRESNFGYYTFAASLGQFIGPPIGDWLIDHSGFGAAFTVATLVTALSLPLLARIRTDPGPPPAAGPARRPDGIVDLLRNPWVLTSMAASSGVLFGVGIRESFYPIYLGRIGFSAATIGVLVSARALSAMLVRPFIRSLTPLFGRRGLLIAAMVLVAAGLAVTPWTTSFAVLLVAAIVTGVGHGLSQPLTMVMVADAVDARVQGLAAGLRLSANRAAQATNPLLYGVVARAFGLAAAFHLAAGVVMLAAGCTVLLLRLAAARSRGHAQARAGVTG